MNASVLKLKIKAKLMEHLNKCLSYMPLDIGLIIDDVNIKILKDLNAYLINDPAAYGYHELVIEAYATFHTVMLYRIANSIQYNSQIEKNLILARKISEYAKSLSGIEIHPKAQIGSGFVLDHGYGTVIGETVTIGDNCYMLNNVTLGARGISNNPSDKRHPSIGNNVQIGASAKIYGNITIGDNCFIGPDVEITKSLPPYTNFTCMRIQQEFDSYGTLEIYGIQKEQSEEALFIFGSDFEENQVECYIENPNKSKTQLNILGKSKNKIKVHLLSHYLKLKKILLTFQIEGKIISRLSISTKFLL